MTEEIWKDIIGYEGFYQVSSFGNVRSLDRYVNCNKGSMQFKKGMPIKPFVNHKGYGMVDLKINEVGKTISVHRIVAQNFIENPENKPQVNHKDGNKLNNHITNLEWMTNKENINHASENKLLYRPNGEKCHYSKLTANEVIEIRKLKGKKTHKEIAKLFNVAPSNIGMILLNKTWKHIL